MQAWYSPQDLQRMSVHAFADLARSHLVHRHNTFPITIAAEIFRRAAHIDDLEVGTAIDAVLIQAAADRRIEWLFEKTEEREKYPSTSTHALHTTHH